MSQEQLISELKNLLNYEKLNNYLRNKLINLNILPFQAILKERKVLSFNLDQSEIISALKMIDFLQVDERSKICIYKDIKAADMSTVQNQMQQMMMMMQYMMMNQQNGMQIFQQNQANNQQTQNIVEQKEEQKKEIKEEKNDKKQKEFNSKKKEKYTKPVKAQLQQIQKEYQTDFMIKQFNDLKKDLKPSATLQNYNGDQIFLNLNCTPQLESIQKTVIPDRKYSYTESSLQNSNNVTPKLQPIQNSCEINQII